MGDPLRSSGSGGLGGGDVRDSLLRSSDLAVDDDDDNAVPIRGWHGTVAPSHADVEEEYEALGGSPPRVVDEDSLVASGSISAEPSGGSNSGRLRVSVPSIASSVSPERASPRHLSRPQNILASPTIVTHSLPHSLAGSISYANAPPLTPVADRHGPLATASPYYNYQSANTSSVVRSPSSAGTSHQMTMPVAHSRHSPHASIVEDPSKVTRRILPLDNTPSPSQHPRLRSLDFVRGLTIAVMILVDGAGGTYNNWMDHSPWDGVRLADFVFPFFLFISGVSIPLSSAKFLNPPEDPESPRVAPLRYSRCCNRLTQWWRQPASPRTNLVSKSFIRFLKLFLIGFILQGGGFPNHYRLDTIRIPGILQRIGFCYFVVVLLEAYTPRFEPEADPNSALYGPGYMWLYKKYRLHWFFMGIITAVYLLLLFVTSVPNCPVGSLTAACNAARYWDQQILGSAHLYQHPTYTRLPECQAANPPSWCSSPFDPEGIVSSIMAIGSCWFGLMFGHVLLDDNLHYSRLKQWLPLSLVLVAISFILHYTCLPFNKNLWSVSYTLLMAGVAGLLLSASYFIIDIKQKGWLLQPFIFMGSNAILVFVGAAADLLESVISWFYLRTPENNLIAWFKGTVLIGWLGNDLGLLVYILIKILVWLLISYALFKKRLFWKI